MDKTIEPVNFNASQELIENVGAIFDKLSKFHDRIISLDIYLKSMTETPTRDKKVEVRVFLPGKDIFVEQQSETFKSAAQQAYDRLKILLIKEKEKQRAHI
ncbi:MAG TPA: HPF/RaiA family ribosome-associated protein [Cryomorphaceae bacterium]|nr:HPF/RaiA family ribosome-associated protein [Cryomorphaceae bacterium]